MQEPSNILKVDARAESLRSLQDGELRAEGHVLEDERVAAEEGGAQEQHQERSEGHGAGG